MIIFECDYTEGAHPEILKKMEETNYVQTPGYGMDVYCESAREKILEACGSPSADVHFLAEGHRRTLQSSVLSSVRSRG